MTRPETSNLHPANEDLLAETPDHHPGASDLGAIGLALSGFTLWVLADTTIKLVGRSRLPAYEIIAILGIFVCGYLALYAAIRGETGRLWPVRPRRQFVRSCLDLANNLCVVVALRHVPLTLFYILIFLAPMSITVLAAIFLHEKVGLRKAVAVAAGFAGVVIAVNPFSASRQGDWIGFAACMVCVSCFSVNMVWSRVLTRTESPESLAFFSGMVMAVAGGGAMLVHAEPVSGQLLAGLFAMGAFCAAGSICFFMAVKHTTASNVSQYHYTQLVTGALVSYLVWRELPTVWMVIGGGLIVASGLYIAVLARRSSVAAPGFQSIQR
ncbi:MAG TPA: DMT family transporter [Terracidiphilus sp.]